MEMSKALLIGLDITFFFNFFILSNWIGRIRKLVNSFQSITYTYIYKKQIYKKQNQVADLLSKRSIHSDLVKFFLQLTQMVNS